MLPPPITKLQRALAYFFATGNPDPIESAAIAYASEAWRRRNASRAQERRAINSPWHSQRAEHRREANGRW